MKIIDRIIQLALWISSSILLISYATPFFHPASIPWLPFMGLMYPVWVFSAVIITTIALIRKIPFKYIGVFVLFIGLAFHVRLISYSFFDPAPTENSIKLLTYNVRLFGVYDDTTTHSRDNIFKLIREEQPDIACFQEYYRQDKPTSFETYDSIRQIMNSIDYHERSAHNERGKRNFGIAIFSKYPMIARGDVMFESQGTMDFNYCVFADVVCRKDTVRIYNVHLQSIRLSEPGSAPTPGTLSMLKTGIKKMNSAYIKRADQARKVIEHMESSPYPIVVCGDFNDTPMSYTYHQFYKKMTDGFREASFGLGATYIGRIPAGRIDYVFHTDELSCSNFNVHKVSYSDHRPITCTINFSKP
jgi:endonuclease/exonuclease/phosphatase family metal-dependent hydrolase